jgi:hypothetical protein
MTQCATEQWLHRCDASVAMFFDSSTYCSNVRECVCICICSGSALGPNNVDIVVVGEQVRNASTTYMIECSSMLKQAQQ